VEREFHRSTITHTTSGEAIEKEVDLGTPYYQEKVQGAVHPPKNILQLSTPLKASMPKIYV